ncbi:cupin family protein [Scheffersomyces coipomensis]|uniref:cupin family protein n=1 Tax=Scheffersomyces coipomensis TaxID=1788519 RepID=UPI00315D2669
MSSASEWIKYYDLEGHPEGGYFKQTGASTQIIKSSTGLQVPLYTNIIFLLEDKNPSNFHQIKSNEVWYFHNGSPLTVHCIYPDTGKYEKIMLGRDITKGEVFQYEVPAGVIFGSSVEEGFAIVSCMVAPGFDFREFKLFNEHELLETYPQHKDIIKKLTPKK